MGPNEPRPLNVRVLAQGANLSERAIDVERGAVCPIGDRQSGNVSKPRSAVALGDRMYELKGLVAGETFRASLRVGKREQS